MTKRWIIAAVAPLCAGLSAAACETNDADAAPDDVAVAGIHALTVAETVELLSQQSQLPASPDVVQALAELWTDYTLLAEAALTDSTLAAVDLSTVVDLRTENELIRQLRESALEFDTVISDAELEALYEDELPGAQVRARHILLNFDQRNETSRDSAQALAASLRDRVVAGESFAELAEEYSKDPASAANGGDLGFFTRTDMVPPFADAAFALAPGEVSEPVETIYGLHLIRTEERRVTPLDSIRGRYLTAVKQRRMQQAESLYVAQVDEEADAQVDAAAHEVLQSLARNPGTELSRRAARRALVTYNGGAFRAEDLQRFLQAQSPAFRDGAARATEEQAEGFLEQLTRGKVLVERARAAGIEVSEPLRDTFEIDARVVLVQSTDRLGLRGAEPQEGETTEQAVDRIVMQTLTDMMASRRQVVPLGSIAYALREGRSARVIPGGVQLAADSLAAWRAAQTPPPEPQPATADTTG